MKKSINGAKRIGDSFWINELRDEEHLITRDEIKFNMLMSIIINEHITYITRISDKMYERGCLPLQIATKKESIKKRIFRRFFPWKKNRS